MAGQSVYNFTCSTTAFKKLVPYLVPTKALGAINTVSCLLKVDSNFKIAKQMEPFGKSLSI